MIVIISDQKGQILNLLHLNRLKVQKIFGTCQFKRRNHIKFLFSDRDPSHNFYLFSYQDLFFSMEIQNQQPQITIGYYPFRGKAQICRLLCEYLHIPFEDKHFTPDQWNRYKEDNTHKWVIKDLPFLQHGDFIVTGTGAIIQYLLDYANRCDLVGKTIDDKLKVDTIRSRCDLNETMLGVNCTTRPSCPVQFKKNIKFYWQHKILPTLKMYENECVINNWYLGYLTIMDFIIYQIINHVEKMFSNQIKEFPKLLSLRLRFSLLPEIQEYENSNRAVTEYCPVRYFTQFKYQKLRANQLNSSVSTASSSRMQIDLQ